MLLFVDFAKIYVRGGDGGNGCVAFRREKYVPMGGPFGGDGGRGGNVVLVTDPHLTTLMDFRYKKHYKAERGEHGMGKNQNGANAEDLVLRVPVGTVVRDKETGEMLADLTEPGQTFIAARGGRGGKGNTHFASAKNKAPSFAERGEPGQERWLVLELKILADVGLVGYPNAGKSTLISAVSAARPKIADYPFTTLTPNLGMVQVSPGESFVIADIPGIIEGAHAGAGLGHQFLRHIERTRVLVYVLDCAQVDGRDVVEDYRVLRRELEAYRSDLASRPAVIAANKMDLPGAEENLGRLAQEAGDTAVYPISAATRQGVDELVQGLFRLLEQSPVPVSSPENAVVHRLQAEKDLVVEKTEEGIYVVTGERVEKMAAMTDLMNDEALRRFLHKLDRMGLDDKLKEQGAKTGDTVNIAGFEFEFHE